MMGLLLTLIGLWILWKLFKLSLHLLFWIAIIAVAAFFVKVLILPAVLLIGGIIGWGVLRA